MSLLSSTDTNSLEQTQLNKASDTVHEEGNYSDEYSRTHGQPESQRDPTMFKNTDQDNLVDVSINDTNIETANTTAQELTKPSETTNMTDNHPQSKSEEHNDKHGKTGNHSPTRRKSLTNQARNNTNDHSNTKEKTVHHSPTRKKSINHDTHGKTADHSPTRRKSITHDTHKDASGPSDTHGRTENRSPTRRKSITNDGHKDTHGKADQHSPTRRKSITHDTHKDASDHPNTHGKTTTHTHTDTHGKTANHSPTRRKSITHGTRRKSDAHEHEKDQSNKSDKIENSDLIIANTGDPTQIITDASSVDNKQTQ